LAELGLLAGGRFRVELTDVVVGDERRGGRSSVSVEWVRLDGLDTLGGREDDWR
jgi:hypothetical protein